MYTKTRNNIIPYKEDRCIINGDVAVKPYYYMRNGLLHVRHTVDRAVDLSKDEESKLKVDMSMNPADKQGVLAKAWSFMTACVGKPIIMDGIKAAEERMDILSSRFGERKNGRKD